MPSLRRRQVAALVEGMSASRSRAQEKAFGRWVLWQSSRSCPFYSSVSTLKGRRAGPDLMALRRCALAPLTSSFERRTHVKGSVGFAVVLLLGMCHLVIADPAIKPGIDVFTTVGRGFTYYDFSKNPVPASFFCDSSSTFTGRVALKGLPVETGTPGQLRNTDTIVERLDEAVFDAHGVAETRIRFRALSMVSIAPIKSSCGAFHVYVTLDGKQPVTT